MPGCSRGVKQGTLDSVPAQWLSWAQRWREYDLRERATTKHMFTHILIAGRWAAQRCPEAVDPAVWNRDIAASYVADTVAGVKGQWAAGTNTNKRGWGDPMTAAAIGNRLDAIRAFFLDLMDWEWIPATFDPRRVLATPKPVRAQLIFNPRIIDDASWAKLMAAGLTLNIEDLAGYGPPHWRHIGKHTHYPIEMMRALVGVWLFAGLRIDEIRRLAGKRHSIRPVPLPGFVSIATNNVSTVSGAATACQGHADHGWTLSKASRTDRSVRR
jgi:hypothetical protein